jgi:hypothetical protein
MTESERRAELAAAFAAQFDRAMLAFSEKIDGDALEMMMAWTPDAPFEMRYADAINRFALNPDLPLTRDTFRIFIGEPDRLLSPAFWKRVRQAVGAARLAAKQPEARKSRAEQLIADTKRALDNAKVNVEMIARYTAPPEIIERVQININEGSGPPVYVRMSGAVPARVNRKYDTRPIEKPKPTLVLLAPKRAYFND